MSEVYWSWIQSALLYAYGPILSYWLVLIVFLGVLIPLYNLMFGFFRWLTGRGSVV